MFTTLFWRSVALAACAGALLPAAGAASEPLQTTSLIRGQATAVQQSPGPIARGVGDVNGDGRSDVALAVNQGVAVVYGTSPPVHNEDLAGPLGDRGFRVDTSAAAGAVWDLGGAGDFDHDGFDDVVISTDAAVYVVYGAATTNATLTLAAGPRVTALTGKASSDAVDDAVGIGDFDGDGFDDVALQRGWVGSAIVSGGPRVASISAASTSARVSLIGASQRCMWVLLTYRCSPLGVSIAPAGDFDGDGLDDLVVENTLLGADGNFVLYGRTGRFSTAATAGAGKTQLPGPTHGEGTGIMGNTQPAGDVNGDGADDLVVWHSAVLLGRRGRPATLAATEPVITLTGGTFGHVDVQPAGDQDGDGAGDLFVDGRRVLSALPRSAPGTAAIDAAPLIGGLASGLVAWPAGDVDGDGLPDGIAGVDTSAYVLTHQAGSAGSVPLPATLEGNFGLVDRNGQSISGATWTFRVTCAGQTGPTLTAGYPTTTLVASGSDGDACSVAVQVSLPSAAAYASCSWQDVESVNDVTPVKPAGSAFRLRAGANRWSRVRRCVIAPTTYPASLRESAWVQAGSVADFPGDTPSLTTGANQRGSVLWPVALDYRNRTIEFTSFLYSEPGVTPGEGMTVAFVAPDSNGKPAGGTLGWGGPLLGFGGLQGVAVAFDTRKSGPADPSGNFIGFTNGSSGAALRWLQTADAGVSLVSSSLHTIKIVNKAGLSSVFIDGVQRMQGPLPIGASSFLAFTAATSSAWHISGPWYASVTAS
jgi:hypothetical protein